MFDPWQGDTVSRSDVLNWHTIKGTTTLFAILRLQKEIYAVLLKPDTGERYDQLVADRFKFMCNIEPMYVIKLDVCLKVIRDQELPNEEGRAYPYLMIHCDFDPDEHDIAHYKASPTIDKCKLTEEQLFEVYKILLFRYMIGVRGTKEEHIVLRRGKVVSISEMSIGISELPRALVSKCLTNNDMLKRAAHEVTKDFDFDCLRGIIYGTMKPERGKVRARKLPMTLEREALMNIIEDRCETLKQCPIDELRNALSRN
jgi:hypothetical protein